MIPYYFLRILGCFQKNNPKIVRPADHYILSTILSFFLINKKSSENLLQWNFGWQTSPSAFSFPNLAVYLKYIFSKDIQHAFTSFASIYFHPVLCPSQ